MANYLHSRILLITRGIKTLCLTVIFFFPITLFSQSKDTINLVSLDAMLGHVDEVVRRMETSVRHSERSEESTPPRSASSMSGYVGTIPMTSGVSPSGAKTYSIPIMTTDAPGGAPAVSLEYNSQGRDGVAGYGWEIGGISTITAANKTPYYNGTAAGASVNYTSVWALDGMPLVQHEQSGMGSYTLKTARGNVFAYPGSLSIQALSPDGSHSTYGNGATGVGAINPVTRTEDRNGNLVLYEYTTVGTGRLLPSRIRYGGKTEATCSSSIVFSYSSRYDVPVTYHAAGYSNPGGLLKAVTCLEGSDTLAHYDLTHMLRNGVWVLTQVDCSRNDVSLQPLVFSYNDSAPSQHSLTSGTVYFSAGYSPGTALVINRGKLLEGSFEDGIVFHPYYPQYTHIGSIYGSGYPSNVSIAIAPPPLSDSFVGLKTNVKTGVGFQVIMPVDADGDGTDEILRVNFATSSGNNTTLSLTTFRFNGANVIQKSSRNVSVKGTAGGSVKYPTERRYYFGDFTACGHAQLLTTTKMGSTSYAAVIDLSSGVKIGEAAMPSALAWNSNLLVLDINRDGRTEVCLPDTGGLRVFTVSNSGILVQDRFFNWGSAGNPYGSSSARNFIADINGDGYPDIMTAPSNKLYTSWSASIFSGEGFTSQTVPCGIFDPDNDAALFMDVNRDGLPDYVKAAPYYLNVHLNNHGANFSPNSPLIIARESGMEAVPVNMTELGAESNVMMVSGAKAILIRDAAQSPVLREIVSSTDGFGNRIQNTYADLSTDPLYGEEEPVHYVVDDSYVPDASAGLARLASPVRVLIAERSYMGSNSGDASDDCLLSKVFHVRKNAVVSTRGLGFLGFASSASRDALRGITSQTKYDPAKFGVPVTSSSYLTYAGASSPFRTDSLTWDSHSTTYGKLDPRLIAQVTIDALSALTTRTTTYYDSYGYPVRSITRRTTTGIGGGDVKGEDTYNIYSHSVSSSLYVLGSVTSTEVTRIGRLYGTSATMDGEPATDIWSKKTGWVYDAQKRPVKRYDYAWLRTTYLNEDLLDDEISADYDTGDAAATSPNGPSSSASGSSSAVKPEPLRVPKIFHGGNLALETRWTYDTYGNIISEKTFSHGATTGLETTHTFDSSGRHVLSTTDPLGQTTTFSAYDVFGHPASMTDRTGTTSYTYDAWGKLVRTDRPDGTWETDSLAWGGRGLYVETVVNSLGAERVTHCDAAGRTVRSADRRFDGSWRYTDTDYDAAGRVSRVSLPFKGSSASLWNTYTYDDYGRQTLMTEASGRTTSRAYAGVTTSVTSDGITTSTTGDADGGAVSITDPGGTITNVLQPDGQPVKTTSPGGAVTTLRYDQWRNRSRIVAPSFGTQTDTTVWNADGTSLSTTVNRYGTVSVARDIYGRTTAVTRSISGNASQTNAGAFNTAYSYDSYGRLVSETSTNGTSYSYTYDSYDRPLTVSETLAAHDGIPAISFTTTTAYAGASSGGSSPVGAVTSVTRSLAGTTLAVENYSYAYGHHTATTLSGATGVTDGTVVWSLTSENDLGQPTASTTLSITRSYGYDQYGLPTGRRTGTLSESYSMDAITGTLSSRTPPPGPGSPSPPGTEVFTHDALNRVSSWTGASSSPAATAAYDTKGNITSLSTSGTMAYSGGTGDPYSITGYTPASSSSARTIPTIVYNPMGRPVSVSTDDDYLTQFTYDADGERVETLVMDDKEKITLRRIYLGGGSFERDLDKNGAVTAERLWLDGGPYSAPVVLTRSSSSGSWTPCNVGRDLLGSITSVQSAGGTVLEQRSYDPWGRARDPQTLVLYATGSEPDYMLGRGFTGHEWLADSGLWNANARLYDPVLGRFLSPDPFVQAPGFTQNYNRFAYALNSPLKYTDESGDIFTWSVGTGGFSVGINLSTLGIPIGFGINIGWKNGFSLGGYGELGYRFGGTGLGYGATTNVSYNYNFKSNSGSWTSSYGLYGSLGFFNANVSYLHSAGHCGWNIGVGFGIGDPISGAGMYIGYGSSGFSIGIGGYYDNSTAYAFRKACQDLSINNGPAIEATDEMLLKCQQEWYPDAPMDNIKDFTVEHVPEKFRLVLKKNNTLALTSPRYYSKKGLLTGISSVYFSEKAFASARRLYGTMGHEFVHVCNYITAAQLGFTRDDVKSYNYIELTEYWAYSYENLIKSTYNSFDAAQIISAYGYETFSRFCYYNMAWFKTRKEVFKK